MGSEMQNGVPERYRFLYQGFVPSDDEPRSREALPFERIQLADTSVHWFGDPSPTILLCRDGTAEIRATPWRRGRVHLFDFGRLCEHLEHVRFSSLAREYHWGGYDASTFVVTVWPAGGGAPISVSDTGDAGPVELWGVRAAIEGVAQRVRWEKPDRGASGTQGK